MFAGKFRNGYSKRKFGKKDFKKAIVEVKHGVIIKILIGKI